MESTIVYVDTVTEEHIAAANMKWLLFDDLDIPTKDAICAVENMNDRILLLTQYNHIDEIVKIHESDGEILKKTATIPQKDNILHLAVNALNCDLFKYLLSIGFDPNGTNDHDFTCYDGLQGKLRTSIFREINIEKYIEMFEAMNEVGCEPHIYKCDGDVFAKTMLRSIMSNKKLELFDFLLRTTTFDINTKYKEESNCNLFLIAIAFNKQEAISYLMDKTLIDIRAVDSSGKNAYLYAAKSGNVELMKILGELNFMPYVVDNNGITAYKITSSEAVKDYLKEMGGFLPDGSIDPIIFAEKHKQIKTTLNDDEGADTCFYCVGPIDIGMEFIECSSGHPIHFKDCLREHFILKKHNNCGVCGKTFKTPEKV